MGTWHRVETYEPRVYLREATLRAVRNPGIVTLARDLKSQKAEKNQAIDPVRPIPRERARTCVVSARCVSSGDFL